jgi:hypothetical protein
LVTILDSCVSCDSKALIALSTTPARLNILQRMRQASTGGWL